MVKTMAEGLAQVENAGSLRPVLVSIEDGWQIAYELEDLGRGWVAVFIPQALTPMSGNVMYFSRDRIKPLDVPMVQAMAIIKHIGIGSQDALRDVELTSPGP